jgi:hypothetical protein
MNMKQNLAPLLKSHNDTTIADTKHTYNPESLE